MSQDPSILDGRNEPISLFAAAHDGHRSVRLLVDGKHIGLVTATYSYRLNHDERVEVARRITAMWNIHRSDPTDELDRAAKAISAADLGEA